MSIALLARKYDFENGLALPMNQDASSSIKSLLNEGITGRKMLNDVLIFHVINLDDLVLQIHKEIIVKRQSHGRKYMGDVGLCQGIFTP